MANIIEVDSITKTYKGNVKAVRGLSFTVPAGICFGLLGPNGAGKSTTLEILQGILKPSSGSVRIFSMTYQKQENEIRKKIGGVLQKTELYDRMKVYECLELFASLYENSLATDEVLAIMELSELKNRQLRTLSGGQKQRVYISTAVVGRPQLIFLDEPTTGLDPSARQDLWHLIEKMKAEGKTILLTTHYMDEAEFLCDQVLIIDRGQRIESGSSEQIIDRVMHDVKIPTRPRRATLNDVFLKLTGRELNS